MTRIHILGASGSGTSTLGAVLAEALAVPHLDSDDFFWLPTDPPFSTPRPKAERIVLIMDRIAARPGWVLSGSAINWGQPLEPLYDLIVYLGLAADLRMARLRERERRRHGERIEAGGDMEATHAEFIAWAARYDSAGLEQRSRAAHEAWLERQTAAVMRLDSARPVPELVSEVLAAATRRSR